MIGMPHKINKHLFTYQSKTADFLKNLKLLSKEKITV